MYAHLDETPEQQRERVIRNANSCEARTYDLAIALGYAPERYDGMWKLRPRPFEFHKNHIIAYEVHNGAGDAVERVHAVKHRIPKGWAAFCAVGYAWQKATDAHRI